MSKGRGITTEEDFASQNFIAVVIQQKSVQGRYGIPAQQHPVGQNALRNLNVKRLKAEVLKQLIAFNIKLCFPDFTSFHYLLSISLF